MKEGRVCFTIEVVAFLAVAVLTFFWVREPNCPYEPCTVNIRNNRELAQRIFKGFETATEVKEKP